MALYPTEHILLPESFVPPLQIPFTEYLFLYIFDQPKPRVLSSPWRSEGTQQLALKNQGTLERPVMGCSHPGMVVKDTRWASAGDQGQAAWGRKHRRAIKETKSERIVTGNGKMFYSGHEAFVSCGPGSREISREVSQAFVVTRTHRRNFHPQLL